MHAAHTLVLKLYQALLRFESWRGRVGTKFHSYQCRGGGIGLQNWKFYRILEYKHPAGVYPLRFLRNVQHMWTIPPVNHLKLAYSLEGFWSYSPSFPHSLPISSPFPPFFSPFPFLPFSFLPLMLPMLSSPPFSHPFSSFSLSLLFPLPHAVSQNLKFRLCGHPAGSAVTPGGHCLQFLVFWRPL